MPHDAAAPVTVRPDGLDRRLDRGVDRPVLVVLRDSLDEPVRLVAEDDEVLQQVEEPVLVEDALDQHLQLRAVR